MKNFKIQYLLVLAIVALTFAACDDDDDETCIPDTALEGATSNVSPNADSSTYSIYSDIVINASQEEVWDVLTDWDNMGNWSTSFIGLTGDIQNGGQVTASYIVGTDTFHFPHALHYVEGTEFGWSDPIAFAPEIVDNHLFKVESISDCQTRFIQTDEFTGENPMFPLPDLAAQTEAGYNQFNAELKGEVE